MSMARPGFRLCGLGVSMGAWVIRIASCKAMFFTDPASRTASGVMPKAAVKARVKASCEP